MLNIGGGAANTAVDLARLGVTAAMLRPAGRRYLRPVRRRDARGKQSGNCGAHDRPELPTSQTLIVNVRGEDRRFIHCVGANAGFVAADLDRCSSSPPRVLHIGYFLILPRPGRPANWPSGSRRARAQGRSRCSTWRRPARASYLDPLKIVLPHTDVFVPNTDEAELILGERDPVRQALAFHETGREAGHDHLRRTRRRLGFRSIRVKLGTYPIKFVDGSGGGDAFNAGYIVGLLEGRSELDCLKLAGAARGASCVRAVGTTAGKFSRGRKPTNSSAAINLRSNRSGDRGAAGRSARRGLQCE